VNITIAGRLAGHYTASFDVVVSGGRTIGWIEEYWGGSLRVGQSAYGVWRDWLKLYANFIIFWTLFELLFMFTTIVFLIHLVVLRSTSNSDYPDAGGPFRRLARLFVDDQKFSCITLFMVLPIARSTVL
jgi:hypothetical protein